MILRNPTVGDVITALCQFAPDQPFMSAASVFTEVGFEEAHDPDGHPFLVMSVLGTPMSRILRPPS